MCLSVGSSKRGYAYGYTSNPKHQTRYNHTVRSCEVCNRVLPAKCRADKRYCRAACRVSAHRTRLIGARSQGDQLLRELQSERAGDGLPELVVDPYLTCVAALAAAKQLEQQLQDELERRQARGEGTALQLMPMRHEAELPREATHVGIAGARGPRRCAVICVVGAIATQSQRDTSTT